ncbi:putative oxidoreductase C-terminal domain-containing protein [Algoriphagus sp. CAU 1675]|uniref:putative oxidoreductase C-terminal domain-containing protein n=1 Tax=Algoriphagus sp. CAU 1675 TaxID=3032597 RepID=UPI0023DC20A0|nr:putative oxidoreductase C-terminal domain-containing protein [Algoriphagus sp. CAU 1675]MDF2157684.1 putative oxidoreductase C-terminal domain-containing protein [Algoriphagus sp. CAU 1675]
MYRNKILLGVVSALLLLSCGQEAMKNTENLTSNSDSKVRIMALDPGHFHAGLIHKSMYQIVDSTIYVFAPEGPELKDYLSRIEGYNTREESPTAWSLEVFVGDDYLQKMLSDKPGNVMVVAGKNDLKIDYILSAIQNGLNVYADKPLVINSDGFQKLVKAFKLAEDQNLLLYDIMTERFEITTLLQRELSMIPEVFGQLEVGTPENPAITKESVHYFFKYVSGKPLVRPDWFFDVEKEGDGIVDVTTHLVDLIQWEAFPNQVLDTADVQMLSARRWATPMTLEEFEKVTGKAEFPDFLQKDIDDDEVLQVYSNGEMNYTLQGKHAKVSVIWGFQAPEGTGDTHFSMMRGSKANLIIRQGKEENYRPVLYVKLIESSEDELSKAVRETLQGKYPGIDLEKLSSGEYRINVPEKYHNGHEAHFGQVTERYLEFFQEGKMPEWEVPNMITKYYTTTQARAFAMK